VIDLQARGGILRLAAGRRRGLHLGHFGPDGLRRIVRVPHAAAIDQDHPDDEGHQHHRADDQGHGQRARASHGLTRVEGQRRVGGRRIGPAVRIGHLG
jgi:hypothetical protein